MWAGWFRFVVVILLFVTGTLAGKLVHADSTLVQLRSFDQGSLNKYKAQPEFNYKTDAPAQNDGLLTMLLYYLSKLWSRHISGETDSVIGKVIFYGLMIGAALMLMLNLLGINIKHLFIGQPQAAITHTIAEENVAEMDLDDLIKKALAQQQWRLAIRYQYLKGLKLLSGHNLIQWQAGKTNMDYYYELKSPQLRDAFLFVTNEFEKAWYGNTDVNESHYHDTRIQFEDFYKQLK